jgi:predicted  nucleic acid-binding Zn-ribbon protein
MGWGDTMGTEHKTKFFQDALIEALEQSKKYNGLKHEISVFQERRDYYRNLYDGAMMENERLKKEIAKLKRNEGGLHLKHPRLIKKELDKIDSARHQIEILVTTDEQLLSAGWTQAQIDALDR